MPCINSDVIIQLCIQIHLTKSDDWIKTMIRQIWKDYIPYTSDDIEKWWQDSLTKIYDLKKLLWMNVKLVHAFDIWPAGCWSSLDINLFSLFLVGCRSRALCKKYFSWQHHLPVSIIFVIIVIIIIVVIVKSFLGWEIICLTGAVGCERRDKVLRIANCLLRRSEQEQCSAVHTNAVNKCSVNI